MITDTTENAELEAIQRELESLSLQKKDLLDKQERLNLTQHNGVPSLYNHDSPPDTMKNKQHQDSEPCYMGAPPAVPAPKVFTDVQELPSYSAKIRCPHCHAFVTTEVSYSVGPVSWLVCTMSILLGCVAGCCLIPFCMKNFKDVHHKCPNCRSHLHTVKKL
ncbi:hypothetical protein ACEWY4_003466 [Coilia grayii]|uniref:LITAF domain-containing protein n=1 Tax=Coilia grayii TaxID=363190 RepID=A0ABD1KRB9_9TELE